MKRGKFFLLLSGRWVSICSANTSEIPRYFGQTESSYISQTAYGNYPQAGKRVQSGSAKIYYETYGKGDPIVILHGGLVGSITEMGEFIDHLKNDYLVIAISTRGHGKSEVGTEPLDYAQKAKDVKAVLAQEKITQPIDILGFSDGAYTGYVFAAEYPLQIKKLVAIGAGEWKKAWRSFDLPLENLVNLDKAYWELQQHLRPNRDLANWYKNQTAYYNQVEIGKPLFERVKNKTLVLAGEDDKNAPLDTVIQAYKYLPNADLAIIPNAPHQVFMTNFPAVWAVVEPFLQQK
ncbi:alpha/beta fold hydrolase [Actinobacillus genomosp. 1]|uniref:alpha/beta fold hydrolase n=1 Tax=Actinobacillus genomosp. 1 TaxID=254839 RepID=UPI00244260FC|nr:alpha/beta hydrolase [Actinobacillus genomosp. 1]WGE90451.1 alpha/beta hydrolase [Actinobacillus genomosp. 1]